MNSGGLKVAAALRARLSEANEHDRFRVDIVPVQRRWRGLLRHLRSGNEPEVEYNVIDRASISAQLPKWLIEAIAERPDVVVVTLSEDNDR